MIKNCLVCALLCLLIFGCESRSIKKGELTIQDVEIFKGTPAWELAKSVDDENTSKIKKIIDANPTLSNYQEPSFGMTLLIRAVGTEKYNSAKQLLECGANPNIVSFIGLTALLQAATFSWCDTRANKDPRFVKLLLDYKADPNLIYYSPKMDRQTNYINYKMSPLIISVGVGSSIEKIKLLVEHGAFIDYKTELGETAATEALWFKDVGAAYYLIVEKKAKINDPFYSYNLSNDSIIDKDKPFYPVDLLLDWVYELGSDKYLKKMAIVLEFNKQGVNYYSRKKNIRKERMYQIKTLYPNNWKKYFDRY
jgi:hypothetical protein